MILKKLGTEYKLYGEDDSCIATTQESPHKRLSKKNCDEIFGVIDVDDLAYKHRRVYQDSFEGMNECIMKDAMHQQVGFVAGFNKAMKLNKDKLFTVEDVKRMFELGIEYGHRLGYTGLNHTNEVIQSLQQPTEIEVEIVTHVDLAATPVDSRHPDAYLGTDTGIPFLDENGCLILKKK
jgi:hypothetical protein